jgi:hypothetical protein
MSTERDYLKWVAAGCALVATASAEYAIARACHFPEWVAWTVPGALDAYVLRALRAHREVLTAVLAMVGVNAASHLVTAGVLLVEWPLITAVSAIAPLVLWRVHALGTPGEWRARKIWGVPRASTLPEHDEHGRTEEEDERAYEHPGPYEPDEHTSTPGKVCRNCGHAEHGHAEHEHTCSSLRDCPVCPCAREIRELCGGCAPSTWDEHVDGAVSVAMPDYVPRDWSTTSTGAPDPETVLDTCTLDEHARDTCEHGNEHGDCHVVTCSSMRAHVLTLVPPLPDGYVSAVLGPGDMKHMNQARVLDSQAREHGGKGASVRRLKTVLHVSTPRAQRIKAALDAEHATSTERSTT